MKSTKKIFVVALAALMLVAFTACQANTIPTQVRAITGITGPDYLVGQTFDAKDFTVSVEYTDGTPAELNGSGIVALEDTPAFPTTAAGSYKVTATIGNTSSGNYNLAATATATGTFYVYDVTSIDITTAPTTVTFEEDKTLTDADLAGIVVTATYGKSKTVELDASEYTLKQVGSSGKKVPKYASLADDDYKTTVTVEAKVGGATKATDTYEITVTEAAPADQPFDKSKIDSLQVGYLDEDGEFVTSGVTVWYGATANDVFAVQATDTNNKTAILTNGTDVTLEVQNGNLDTTSATNVVAVLVADPTIKSPAISVTPRNYVVSIAVAQNPDTKIEKNADTSEAAFRNNFTVTATMAADITTGVKTKTLAQNEYDFTVAYLNETNASGAKVVYTGSEENPGSAVAEVAVGSITWAD